MTPTQPKRTAPETQMDPSPSIHPIEPRPWTAPDFVERSTCAEIGAYAFRDDGAQARNVW